MLYLWPTLVPHSSWWGPVFSRFATSDREIWLTIDDGPDPVDTPRILDLLDELGGRATFFVKGSLAAANPDLVGEIRRRGHEVASHSWSHPSATFWCLPPHRLREEIDRGLEAIGPDASSKFRAPIGMKNSFVHPILRERGLDLIGWSIRSLDTISREPERVTERILDRVEPGAILLMHEGALVSGLRGADFIEHAARAIHSRGYQFVIPERTALREARSGRDLSGAPSAAPPPLP